MVYTILQSCYAPCLCIILVDNVILCFSELVSEIIEFMSFEYLHIILMLCYLLSLKKYFSMYDFFVVVVAVVVVVIRYCTQKPC